MAETDSEGILRGKLDMKKIVLYINQFFGGIGGEDEADFEPVLKEGPIGPGTVIQAGINEAQITHTIICGDNYMASHREEATARIDQLLDGIGFDLFLAGPAFQSGRYGMSCGEICRHVVERYHVAAVTCMHEENPGVDAYAKTQGMYIMRGNKSAVKMRQDAAAIARLAKKILAGEEILWAEEEGYFSHGIRIDVECEAYPGDRAVAMMLAKLKGEAYQTEFPIEQADTVTPARPVDAARVKIGVITTGGLVPIGNPDRLPSGTASIWKRYSTKSLESLKKGEFYSVHGGFSTNNVNEDPEVLLPLAELKEAEKVGKIGQLDEYYYVTTGNLTILKEAKRMGREIANELKQEGIEAAILVST